VSIVSLAVQFLGIRMGATTMMLGLYGTVASACYGAMSLAAGRVTDKLGRRVACLSALVAGFAWLALGVQRSPIGLLVLVPVSAVALAYYWPPVQAWIGDLVYERRMLNRVLGNFNVLWTAGLMLGPVVCAYLWVAQPFAPFAAATVIAWLMAVALLAVPRGSAARASDAEGTVAEAGAGDSEAADPRADHYLPLAWAANFVSWSAVGVIRSLFPKLAHDIGYREVTTGWLTFAYYVGQIGAFVLLRQYRGWQYRRTPLVLGLIGGALGMAGAWFGRSPAIFAVAFGVAGLSVGFTYVASLYYSLHAPAQQRGKRAGVHEMTVGAGGALGPLIGGAVATYHGVRASFGALAVVFAVAAVALVVWSLVRRPLAAKA
jgi:MFS family permease